MGNKEGFSPLEEKWFASKPKGEHYEGQDDIKSMDEAGRAKQDKIREKEQSTIDELAAHILAKNRTGTGGPEKPAKPAGVKDKIIDQVA